MTPPLSLDTTGLFLPYTDFSITASSPAFSTSLNSWRWKALNQRHREKYAPSFGDILHSQISRKYTIPKHCISNRILAQTSLLNPSFTPPTFYQWSPITIPSPSNHSLDHPPKAWDTHFFFLAVNGNTSLRVAQNPKPGVTLNFPFSHSTSISFGNPVRCVFTYYKI